MWEADLLQLSYPHLLFGMISEFLELFLKTCGKVWMRDCSGNRAWLVAAGGCRSSLCHG